LPQVERQVESEEQSLLDGFTAALQRLTRAFKQ
jgi:hypothetical protein